MAQEVAFWVLASVAVAAAIMVIRLANIFRAALMLVVAFASVAGLFVLLSAEFLAVVQVLIYVGAISVLIIFAVLLTQDVETGNPSNRLRLPALVSCGLILVALALVAVNTQWETLSGLLSESGLAKVEQVFAETPQGLADLLLQQWVLAFEVVSILLLAAILGAVVIVRERQP